MALSYQLKSTNFKWFWINVNGGGSFILFSNYQVLKEFFFVFFVFTFLKLKYFLSCKTRIFPCRISLTCLLIPNFHNSQEWKREKEREPLKQCKFVLILIINLNFYKKKISTNWKIFVSICVWFWKKKKSWTQRKSRKIISNNF